MKNLFEAKAERQEKFLQKLNKQKEPLTHRQFRRLTKCSLPPETPLSEWLAEWALKSQEKQERQDRIIGMFLQAAVTKLSSLELESSAVITPAYEPQRKPPRKRRVLKWVAVATAACMLCAAIALPIILLRGGGDGGIIEKPYTAQNARVLGFRDGIYFEDIYAEMFDSEEMLVFNKIIPGLGTASKEVYDDETEELLSYVLHGLVADASIGANMIAFTVDFRIRFVPQYTFAEYESSYERLDESFSIGRTEIKYEIETVEVDGQEIIHAHMSFTYGKYDYFLEASVFEVKGLGVISEVTEGNLILLMENLIPH